MKKPAFRWKKKMEQENPQIQEPMMETQTDQKEMQSAEITEKRMQEQSLELQEKTAQEQSQEIQERNPEPQETTVEARNPEPQTEFQLEPKMERRRWSIRQMKESLKNLKNRKRKKVSLKKPDLKNIKNFRLRKPGKKFKKAVITLIVLAVLGGGSYAGLRAYQNYQMENTQAQVVSVSSLNWGYSQDAMTSSGTVTNDYIQSVHIDDQTVKKVKVQQGDEVKKGDKLLVYDTTDIELQLDKKKLELQKIENDITLAKRELERLSKITPVSANQTNTTNTTANSTAGTSSSTSSGTTRKKTTTGSNAVVVVDVSRKDGDANNYIDKKSKPYEGDGSVENPYRFLCTQECYVLGEYLNQLVKKEECASFEIWTGNSTTDGTLITVWTVNGAEASTVADDSRWLVATQQEIEEQTAEEETEEDEDEDDTDDTAGTTTNNGQQSTDSSTESTEEEYTAAELSEAKAEKQSDLNELELDRKSAKLEIKKLKKQKKKATVRATIDGVVKTVGDPQNPPDDGSPFIEVAGADGMYVKGELSEMMLGEITVGQEITANSWNNGQTYTATITEISDYPSDSSNGYYGEGNPNASYYSFTAYIENPDGLTNGDYVDLSMTPDTDADEADAIYIEKAYVRTENGNSYVLKADKNDRLVKQYVKTGKTLYGSAIEIKKGLSQDDRIAFPYGKTAKEGALAVDSDDGME